MEKRSFTFTAKAAPEAEARDDGRFHGTAIVFNSDSVDLGGFIERIAPTALDRTLREVRDGKRVVQAFWSHDSRQPLGSTRSKLKLEVGDDGLDVDLDTTRFTPAQLDTIRDGDAQMSFGFIVRKDSWEKRDGVNVRTVEDLDLLEVSPGVVFPAYEATSSTIRAFEEWRSAQETEETVEVPSEAVDQTEASAQEARKAKMLEYIDMRIAWLSK